MMFRKAFSNSCFFRAGRLLYADVSTSTTANARRCFTLGLDSNKRKCISVARLLQESGLPFAGCKAAGFASTYLNVNTEGSNAMRVSSVSSTESTGEGALTSSGNDDETEGTESGRVSRKSESSDGPLNDEGESIKLAHVATNGNIVGEGNKAVNNFKEYGNLYEKHEPTMFGDWSHMGRVTDF